MKFIFALLLLLVNAGCPIEAAKDCRCEQTPAGKVICNSACEGKKK